MRKPSLLNEKGPWADGDISSAQIEEEIVQNRMAPQLLVGTHVFNTFILSILASAIVSWSSNVQASITKCASAMTNAWVATNETKPIFSYTLKSGDTIASLEPMFKAVLAGQKIRLTIPEGLTLDLFDHVSRPYYGVYEGGPVEFFPYSLKKNRTVEEIYREDLLRSYYEMLRGLESIQRGKYTVYNLRRYKNFIFSTSTTSAASGAIFKNPRYLHELVTTPSTLGLLPFVYKKRNGDQVLTNEHFLDHLKSIGVRSVPLFRAHADFDYFFYRLLLGFGGDEFRIRTQFGNWLRQNSAELSMRRSVSERVIRSFAKSLENNRRAIDEVLMEAAPILTSSAIFTSPTDNMTNSWIGGTERSSYREVLKLRLDLEKLPSWYLNLIQVGMDLDTEIVFPYLDANQIKALRASVRVVSIENHAAFPPQ